MTKIQHIICLVIMVGLTGSSVFSQNIRFSMSSVDNGGGMHTVQVFARCPGCTENLTGFTTYIYFDNTELTFGSPTSPLVVAPYNWGTANQVVVLDNPESNGNVPIVHTGFFAYTNFDNNFTGFDVTNDAVLILEIPVTEVGTIPAGSPDPGEPLVANNGEIWIADATEVTGLQYVDNTFTGYDVMIEGPQSQQILLPVELVDFTVRVHDTKSSLLNWSTASEDNTSYFEVLRSEVGSGEWNTAGYVEAVGNSVQIQRYEFVDKNVYDGRSDQRYFYRLKIVDFDGKFEYSNIEAVKFLSGPSFLRVSAYPNPASLGLTVELDLEEGMERVDVQMYNQLGQLTYSEKIAEQTAIKYIDFDRHEIETGAYILQVIDADNTIIDQQKIIVQRN